MAVGKKITDLTASGSLKDTDLAIIHDGNGTKRSTLTQISEYMGTKFSNPNLLINPNFKINQRRQATYETSGASQIYSVDRWRLGKGKVTVNSDGTVTVTATGGTTNEEGYYQQPLENAISGDYTVSMEVISVSGAVRIAIDGAWQNVKSGLNVFHGITGIGSVGLQLAVGASITLKWVKLEQGSIATPFVAPNMAEELTKCYRFYQRIKPHYSGYVSNNFITYFLIPVKAQTRDRGTITVSDQRDLYNIKEVLSEWSAYSDDYNKCPYIGLRADSDGYARLNCIIEIDAEIY